MVAPVDATASFMAGDEQITLALNFRTIALAESQGADVITGLGAETQKVSSIAVLVWAFAQPAHPDLTLDQALAIVMYHGEAANEAMAELFAKAAPASAEGKAARPPKARGR